MIVINANLNQIYELIKPFVESNKLGIDWKEMSLDLNIDLHQDVVHQLERLNILFKIISKAIEREDWLAALCLVLRMRVYSMNLSSVFLEIYNLFELISKKKSSLILYSILNESDKLISKNSKLENMTVVNIDLNKFKSVMMKLAEYDKQNINSASWRLNYRADLSVLINNELNALSMCIESVCQSLHQKLDEKISCQLMKIAQTSKTIGCMFESMTEDMENIFWSDQGNFPEIPENYKIPSFYDLPEIMR